MSSMNLAALDLNLLVALDRLLDLGSVTLAAQALGLSQPAMSRTLQRLRDELGDPLLVRVGRGLVLTERARELAEPTRDAIRAVRRVFEPPDAFDPLTARGELTVGLGEETQLAFADAIATALWAAAPGIDLRVLPLSASSVEDGRRGRFDLVLTPDLAPLPASAGRLDLSEFVVRPLYLRRWAVISAAARPRPAVTLEEYVAADHAIVSFEGGGRGFVDELLEARGLRRRVAASLGSFPAVATLVARTHLLATVPEELVHTLGQPLVAAVPPLPLPDLQMMAVWHPRRTAEPRHRFLRELVMEAVRTRASPV